MHKLSQLEVKIIVNRQIYDLKRSPDPRKYYLGSTGTATTLVVKNLQTKKYQKIVLFLLILNGRARSSVEKKIQKKRAIL